MGKVMLFDDWCNQYSSLDFDIVEAENCINIFKSLMKNKKNVFYGAKILGEAMCKLFNELKLDVSVVVDKNYIKIKTLNGITVNEPDMLKSLDDKITQIFITVDPYNQESVLHDIKMIAPHLSIFYDGHKIHSILQNAWCTIKNARNEQMDLTNCMNCSIMKLSCGVLKSYLIRDTKFNYKNAVGTDSQKSIGYTLAGVCTLKCKDCHEMTPYAQPSRKKFVTAETFKKDMEHILASCKYVTTIEFVGGEPFAHPDLVEIIEYTKIFLNLGFIHIFSNGTILPSDALCKALYHPRIAVTLTNFAERLNQRQKDAFIQVKEKMKLFNIQYVERFLTTWTEANSFDFVNDNEEELKRRFKDCRFSDCRRLVNGVMYACQHDYAGDLTGLFPLIDNQINIHDYDSTQLSEKLEEFNTREYYNICNYCPLPNRTKSITAAIQL